MRAFPNWIEAYTEHQRNTEAPKHFHFWVAVSVVAGALRRRVWIDERQFQWTPNMYVILVAPPGIASKSTSMSSGIAMLEQVPGINFGPTSMTWQALVDAFVQCQEIVEIPGKDKAVPMSCLTIGASELGVFLDPSNGEAVDFLTDVWDGKEYTLRKRTVGRGEQTVKTPWLNFIGCTTPTWLKARMPMEVIGGGLTSRIVFVYADKKEKLIPYPSRLSKEDEYDAEEQMLVHDLIQISSLAGPYQISEAAYDWGDAWYHRHYNGGLALHLKASRYEGYIARKQVHIHKLAIILAAAKRSELIIELEDLIEAEKCIVGIEPDMAKVFDSIGVSAAANITNEIIKRIQISGSVSYKQLWKECFHIHDAKSFTDSITAAINAGIVKKESGAEKDDFKLTYVKQKGS